MGRADYFKPGAYNAICDQCGIKFKNTDMRMRWDGAFVCKICWEPRHPQDFVRSIPDKQSVPIARPPTEDVFVDPDNPTTPEDL